MPTEHYLLVGLRQKRPNANVSAIRTHSGRAMSETPKSSAYDQLLLPPPEDRFVKIHSECVVLLTIFFFQTDENKILRKRNTVEQ